MTEMETRVTQAIWQAHKDNINLRMPEVYPLMARAAIEAMREPTEAMLGDFPGLHADVWERMINAALTAGQVECPACKGSGVTIHSPEGCTDCYGTGYDRPQSTGLRE